MFDFRDQAPRGLRIRLIALLCCGLGVMIGCGRTEAHHIGKDFIERTFIDCGDSRLAKSTWNTTAQFMEIKDMSWDIAPQRLTEADRLNEYKWRGKIIIRCGASRAYSSIRGWGSWRSDCAQGLMPLSTLRFPMENKNDQWTVLGFFEMDSYNPERPDCSLVGR